MGGASADEVLGRERERPRDGAVERPGEDDRERRDGASCIMGHSAEQGQVGSDGQGKAAGWIQMPQARCGRLKESHCSRSFSDATSSHAEVYASRKEALSVVLSCWDPRARVPDRCNTTKLRCWLKAKDGVGEQHRCQVTPPHSTVTMSPAFPHLTDSIQGLLSPLPPHSSSFHTPDSHCPNVPLVPPGPNPIQAQNPTTRRNSLPSLPLLPPLPSSSTSSRIPNFRFHLPSKRESSVFTPRCPIFRPGPTWRSTHLSPPAPRFWARGQGLTLLWGHSAQTSAAWVVTNQP